MTWTIETAQKRANAVAIEIRERYPSVASEVRARVSSCAEPDRKGNPVEIVSAWVAIGKRAVWSTIPSANGEAQSQIDHRYLMALESIR